MLGALLVMLVTQISVLPFYRLDSKPVLRLTCQPPMQVCNEAATVQRAITEIFGIMLSQAVALPLAKVTTGFQYVPPVAVAVTGLAYLALANLLHDLASDNLVGRSANQ